MPRQRQHADHAAIGFGLGQAEAEVRSATLPPNDAAVVDEPGSLESAHDALLAMLATQTGQIVWVRDAAGLVTWEARWSAYTGQTPGSAMGLHWLSAIHPEDVTRTVQAWATALETAKPYEVEQRIRRADGEYRVFRSRAMPVLNDGGSVREWVGVSVDITEFADLAIEHDGAVSRERTAWEQRNDAYRRLLAVLESTSECFFSLDREWRIMYMNAAAERLIGISRAEYVGQVLWEKSPSLLGTEFEQAYRRAVVEQTSVELEAYYPTLDKWYGVRAFPSAEGLSVFYRDVTATKRKEVEVQRRERDLEALFERTPVCIVVTDAVGVIERANLAFRRLLGYTAEEVIGGNLADFALPEKAAVGEMEPGTVEKRLRHKDGSVVRARMTTVELTNAEGRLASALHTIVDVTELRRPQHAGAEDEAPQPPISAISSPHTILVAPASEDLSYCPACGAALIEAFFVNPAGELVGCPDCADERELAGAALSREEWLGSAGVLRAVLAAFGLPEASRPQKPPLTPRQRPIAHIWEVSTPDGERYLLRRFSGWYPDTAVEYQHSLLAQVAATGLPVACALPARDGGFVVEADGMRWALYSAVAGQVAGEREWQWLRPKAAELLGQLHVALEHATPEGAPFALWGAWDLDTLDRVLASWPLHAELPRDLLGYVRERLATRYFGELLPMLPRQAVHGAYTRENVLWLGEGMSAQGSGILPFAQAHVDTVVADLAAGVCSPHPPALRATVAAYTAVRPLRLEEREALPEAMLLDAVRRLDQHIMYLHDSERIGVEAQALQALVRNLEGLRQAVAPGRR